MNFRRGILVFLLILFTNVFGIFKVPSFLGIEAIDWGLLVITLYTIFLFLNRPHHFRYIINGKITKNILYFLLIVIIVALSMSFRSTGTLFTGLKVGRLFFILLIFVPVYYDIMKIHSFRFWTKLIEIIGITYGVIILLNLINPAFTQAFFTDFIYMKTENAWDTNATRTVLKSNYGLLFIHLAFSFRFLKVIQHQKKIGIIECFLFVSMFFQGWRAILITILFSLILISIFIKGFQFIPKLISYSLIGCLIAFPIDFSTGNVISSKFISAYHELTGEKEGTLAGRLNTAEVYVIPEFLKRPVWGHGFISEKDKTKHLDIEQKSYDKTTLLYNFDFGYLTMLIMFGSILFAIIMLIFLKILYTILTLTINKEYNYFYINVCFAFFLALILANYSFGGLISFTGLLPLGIIVGISQAEIDLKKFNIQQNVFNR